jgi:hypothetical protein
MSTKPAHPALDPLNQPSTLSAFPTEEPGTARSLAPPTGGLRGIVDALLQGALVELFQAYDVALAPLPRGARGDAAQQPDLSALIGFSTSTNDGKSTTANGKLSLSVPSQLFDVMRRDSAHFGRSADWMRELVNQLMGRFKNRLLPYGARLQAGLPSSIGREALEAQLARAANLRTYRARTLRGEVVATLEGTLNENELVYVGQPKACPTLASEGELILF